VGYLMPPRKKPVSGNLNFNSLSEAEQRLVAERLLKIEESGWKPFWCPRSDCDGLPHVVTDENGEEMMVGVREKAGPNGEPVSDIVFETPGGELFLSSPQEQPVAGDTPVGRLVYDPTWAHNHAREDQRLPSWLKPWILFIMSGRGSGKTTTGVEFVTLSARKGLDGAILGRRGTELVNTHVATIIARAHPEFKPEYLASKDILRWPNGAVTYLFSAEKPENIRSVNLSYAWVDEAAFMDEIETAWSNLKLATRIDKPGNPIHILITSTPTPVPWVVKMEDDPDVEVRRVSTYANLVNLSADFIADMRKQYEGTRLGRQELYGEVLRDVEGALWNDEMFQYLRIDKPEDFQEFLDGLDDRALAVDPSGSKGKRSDAHGIIAAGAHHFDDGGSPLPVSRFWVFGRATLKGTPAEMAERTFSAARVFKVNRIIVEKNFGGEHVRTTLTQWAKLHPEKAKDENGEDYKIELVHASQSKETRAEPTVAKYEQGRVTHVTNPTAYGDLSELEKQQVGWVPKSRGGRLPSPNDIDALVWVIRALESSVKFVAQQATGRQIQKMLKRRAS
jgi:phage terminase large subunit-like protein